MILENVDRMCAEAMHRIRKQIALILARATWKPGMPHAARSVGQKFKRKS